MKAVFTVCMIAALIAGPVCVSGEPVESAGSIKAHSSKRYFQDATGKPVFLIGYYNWASVADGYYIDHPARYSAMIKQGMPYKINYIRISLGINTFNSSTDPPVWSGSPTPAPFLYVNGKANLDKWDSTFWDGLKAQCRLARDKGVIAHISIFDGVELRGGSEAYRYNNSFWKPSNQTKTFYSDPDTNGNDNIDERNEFYRLSDFNNNTGLGFYQRKIIDKAISETAAYDNVFYEIGNELLSSSEDWNTAVINYVKSKTSKPITDCGGDKTANLMGWSQHSADTPAQVKSNVASIVGHGYPAWEDPDGPDLSASNISPDYLRRAAWYSFVGGAACWGGFTADFWGNERGFWKPTAAYYKNLQSFIKDSGAKFWEMQPNHDLVSNPKVNSCLAKTTSEYIVYVLNDSTVTVDLSDVTGKAAYRIYNPKTGVWSTNQTIEGVGKRTFKKPVKADDWAIYIHARN